MTAGRALLLVVLLGSMAADVVLFATRRRHEVNLPAPTTFDTSSTGAMQAQEERLVPLLRPDEDCVRQIEMLTSETRRLQSSLELAKMPHQRFEMSMEVPNLGLEKKIRQHLAGGHDADVEVQCRRDVCRVRQLDDASTEQPELELEWARINMRDASTTHDGVYFGIRPPNVQSGYEILLDLVDRLRTHSSAAACAALLRAEQSVRLRIDLNDGREGSLPLGFSVRALDSDAQLDATTCYRSFVSQELSQVELPMEYTGSAVLLTFP